MIMLMMRMVETNPTTKSKAQIQNEGDKTRKQQQHQQHTEQELHHTGGCGRKVIEKKEIDYR